MARDDDRPQFNPKHRIAGAIILVSLAVIFVPMLLDQSKAPAPNQSLTQIPTGENSETKVVVTPVPAPDPVKPSATEKLADLAPVPAPKAEVAKPAPATPAPAPKPVVEAKPEKKSEPPPAKPKPAAKTTDTAADKTVKAWVVQVGTFANSANAERLRDKLKGLGYSVNAESVTLASGEAMRLSVGPYPDKATAAKAQAQLQKEVNIQGLVHSAP